MSSLHIETTLELLDKLRHNNQDFLLGFQGHEVLKLGEHLTKSQYQTDIHIGECLLELCELSPLSGIVVHFGNEYSPVMYISFIYGYGKPMSFEQVAKIDWEETELQTCELYKAWGINEETSKMTSQLRLWWDV